MNWGKILDLMDVIANSPIGRVVAMAVAVLAGVATVVKLINGVRTWMHSRRATVLERKLAEMAGVSAYTGADIANACRSYIEPNCASTDPSDEDDLRNVVALAPLFLTIDEHLKRGGERRHVILLADSGMGKTSFCINYYAREQKKRLKQRQRVAIVPLGSGDPVAQIGVLGQESETVLFLDAFDEDPAAVDDPHGRLRTLMSKASKFKNVVVTCRSQFFENDDSIPKGSGIMYAASRRAGVSREFPLHKLFLAPLNNQQIEKYLAKNFAYSSVRNFSRRHQARKLVSAIPELSVRPMLLELIPDLIREKKSIDQLFGLYEYLVESWLRRERDWIDEHALKEISIELAVVMFLRQRHGLGDRIGADHLEQIAALNNSTVVAWKLKSRSLLNRDIEGNYKFAHRSIMEFLVLVACLRGDVRALAVEWTDLMKDLLVSLANTSRDAEAKTLELLSLDLSATKVFPLATSIAPPRRLSVAECKRVIRNEHVSLRHSRRIPVAWRNMRYDVNLIVKAGVVSSYVVNDQTHGISWLITDVSKVSDASERELYADRFADSAPVAGRIAALFGPRLNASYRHPSLEEMITLWQCEPDICDRFGLTRIFDQTGIYWIGDRVEDGYLCCSFGSEPHLSPELSLIDTRADQAGRKLFLYELLGKYGMVNRSHYRAFCAYIVEEVSDLAA